MVQDCICVWVGYNAKICGIIKSWQCYRVRGDYNGVMLKVLDDEWIKP